MLSDSTKTSIFFGIGVTTAAAFWIGGLKGIQSQIRKGRIPKIPKSICRCIIPEVSNVVVCYGLLKIGGRPLFESNMDFRLKIFVAGLIRGTCGVLTMITGWHSMHYIIVGEYNNEFVNNDDPNDPKLTTD